MLIFTNREIDQGDSENAVSARYTPLVPDLSLADVRVRGNSRGWKLDNVGRNVSDTDALARLSAVFNAQKNVLLYVHGNNNTPGACFTRCQALEASYDVNVIGFSWASEGLLPDGTDGVPAVPGDDLDAEDSLAKATGGSASDGWVQRKGRRYAQAKVNAQQSTAALARFLRLVASARLTTMNRPFSAAFHSLGCHFLHYTIERGGAIEALAAAQNVALIAGCTAAAKHAAWVKRINPLRRVYITYTQADSVLAGAKFIDGDTKLGTDPGAELLPTPKYRYICFDGAAKMKLGAHRYFVPDTGKELSKKTTLLFSRIFGSVADFSPPKEESRIVYPVGCSPDGGVCYMGRPASSEVNGP
jgi:hypothetical protein